MVAGLANIDQQTKILAKASTLTTLQQKFNIQVTAWKWLTSQNPISAISCTIPQWPTFRSYNKKQSQDVRTSPTPQYAKPCRGSGRHSHPHRSRNSRDSPAAKTAYFHCRIVRHITRLCQKPKEGFTNRSAASSTREESYIFGASVYTKGPMRRTRRSSKVNRRGKANT